MPQVKEPFSAVQVLMLPILWQICAAPVPAVWHEAASTTHHASLERFVVQFLAERVNLPKLYSLVLPKSSSNAASSSSKQSKKKSGSRRRGRGAAEEDEFELGLDLDELEIQQTVAEIEETWSAWKICEAYAEKKKYRVCGGAVS